MSRLDLSEANSLRGVKVILLEEMESLGVVGEEVKVRASFARNYLLPKHKALWASDANRRAFEANRSRIVSAAPLEGSGNGAGLRGRGGTPMRSSPKTEDPSASDSASASWIDANESEAMDEVALGAEGFETRHAAVAALRAEFELLLGESPEQRFDQLGDLLEEARRVIQEPAQFRGRGLGSLVSVEEGRAAVDRISTDDVSIDWAQSRLLGAADMARELDISPATLANWRNEGNVIAFKRDRRNYSYPLRQVYRGAPINGLARIARYFDQPDAAWEWMVTANVYTQGLAPIDRLRLGKLKEVERAAEGAIDFS